MLKNLRLARIIQGINALIAWPVINLIFRVLLPLWRKTKQVFGGK